MKGTESQKRSLKSLPLTAGFRWAYIGSWLVLNVLLVFALCVVLVVFINSSSLVAVYASAAALTGAVYLGAALAILSLLLLGLLSAHRIAGVHIRTRDVLERVADGDFEARLRYRSGDRLESVEHAFNSMMEAVCSGAGVSPRMEGPALGEAPRGQNERRKLTNFHQTRIHHRPYMGVWVLTTLSLIAMLHVALLYCVSFSGWLPDLYLTGFLVTTLLMSSAATIVAGKVTAHRLAGVHIKLVHTFAEVKDGNLDASLRFRSQDRLTDLEIAFERMLETLRFRAVGSGVGREPVHGQEPG
jgi:methyl-accepting chemotaxis protein